MVCKRLVWLAAALVLLCCSAALAADTTLTVTGIAAVQDGRVGQARQRAKADALRSAIEQVVGLNLQSRVIIKNELLSSSRLVAYTRGGIKGYRVLEEKLTPGRVWVKLLVTVTDAPASVAGCPACRVLGWPAFYVHSGAPGRWPEVAAARAAVEGGFSDRHFVVRRAGAAPGANVVIELKNWQSSGDFDGTGHQARVAFTASALLAGTRQVLASVRVSAQALHPNRDQAMAQAGTRAGRQACRELLPRLAAWWNHYLAGGLPIEVLLKTPPRSEALAGRFTRALETIPGVVQVRELSFGGGRTRLVVRYRGPAGWLRREVNDALKGAAGFARLRCESSRPRRLVFRLP